MSFGLNPSSSSTCLHSPFDPPNHLLFFNRRNFHVREFRVWRRRRLKCNRRLLVRSQLVPLVETLFQNLVSQFPSVNSLDLFAPALGFASGVALYFSRFKLNRNSEVCDIGEWILFTSPTPFNRFVLLRCPSILFDGGELLEDVNEKLVKEDCHFARLHSGRIHAREDAGDDALEEKLAYQRECVITDDGGVVSLDWPANLDLKEEHGLDTTLLLIPGTAQGSMHRNIRSFVCESLKHGFFPIVMNPRGCAGSPLTTARLFTAADSDDICTAIQFINKARPWTTLMGVGWGYGANMLTKYLAEVEEKTPLTAATCIDNPFDLQEATRSSPYHIAVDQMLTGGLIDILRSNKELFQGRAKGFNVEKALLAKSVHDFDKAISMISYGFDAIENFYLESSSRNVIGSVKIPVLFIQSDDGTVPLFSIPRSSIAENPYTSLLLCSCLPSPLIMSCRSAISWCQHLAIEWLTAVELGLLKGRHPLLKDVDVSINPSRGLGFVEGTVYNKGHGGNKLLDLTESNASNGSIDPRYDMFEESNNATGTHLRPGQNSLRNLGHEDEEVQHADTGVLLPASSVDTESANDGGVGPSDSERGQVLQTAQVVMNMLDITMPDSLTEEQKKKVLTAVDQGETVMKALQDAVPEDVREKLTTAVSGILHSQGSNLKFNGFLRAGQLPNVSSALKSNIPEKTSGLPSGEANSPSSDQRKPADDLADGSVNSQPGTGKPVGELESEHHPSDNFQTIVDQFQSQSPTISGGGTLSSVKKGTDDLGSNHENDGFSIAKATQRSDYDENGLEICAEPSLPSQSEKAGGTECAVVDQHEVEQDAVNIQEDTKEENITQKNAEKSLDSSSDQNKMNKSIKTEVVAPQGSASDEQLMEMENNDNLKQEDKNIQPIADYKSFSSESSPPSFSVSQALDALTGIDDSTQVAVNSVFGVIEDMITHFEEKDNNSELKNRNENEDDKSRSAPERLHINDNNKLEKKEDNKYELSLQSDMLDDSPVCKCSEDCTDSQHDMKKLTEKPSAFNRKDISSSKEDNMSSPMDEGGSGKKGHMVGGRLLTENLDKLRHVNDIPLCVTKTPYGDFVYNEFLRNYLLSKMSNSKPLDLDTTRTLFLDYFPEEGQWMLLEQPGNTGDSVGDVTTRESVEGKVQAHSSAKSNNRNNIIEPSYVILDTDKEQEPVGEYEAVDILNESFKYDDKSEELMHFVKSIILDSLKVEVYRRLIATDGKDLDSNLARDLEQVAEVVSLKIRHNEGHTWCLEGKDLGNVDYTLEKADTLDGEHVIRVISSAVQDTNYLRKVLPIGVIVGSILAALRKFFNVTTVHDNHKNEDMTLVKAKKYEEKIHDQVGEMKTNQVPFDKTDQTSTSSGPTGREKVSTELKNLNDTVMVGAITAALGASALLVHQQNSCGYDEIAETSSKSFKEKGNHHKVPDKIEEAISEKNHNNIVTSLAEKAMSVAGPVVPTKEDGEVDQERLVAMLADLGQKGGMLRLVSKIALLWGGIRGAMSLTDRLIMFLHIAERPLYLRVLGFVCMVLVLWSPVVVPLLPTLVQSWTTHTSSRIAELSCIIGLYIAVTILVMLWGKRIRGYEHPLEQYGLDLTSPMVQNFLKGWIGGVLLVLLIHSVSALLGFVSLSWHSNLPFPLDAMARLKVCGLLLMWAGQGFVTATGVAVVEELLFRSWLHEEISADLGYHRGVFISGLVFSLIQRSPEAIPGLWLLSLILAGIRERSQGSLSIPIGLRAGIMVSSFVLQKGDFLIYRPHFPQWLTGTHPFQPFSGVVGLTFCLSLAIVLYPRQPLQKKTISNTIQE